MCIEPSDWSVYACIILISRILIIGCKMAGNIWTHMLPILYMTSLYASPGIWNDAPWTFVGATLPSIVCLVCSNAYHTMMPLPSQKVYDTLLLVDYLSVFNVMVWPTAILINGSFPCFESARMALLVAYFVFALAMLVLAVRARNVVQRLVPFGLLCAARLCLQAGRAWVGQARCVRASLFYVCEIVRSKRTRQCVHYVCI
jgi:hypothetical protein